jgi:hypothetical protein
MHRVAEYNEKGYTFPVDIFTPAEAAANREYFNWIFAEASTRGINSDTVPCPLQAPAVRLVYSWLALN